MIWGFNFVVITVALKGFPPFFLVFLRLFLTGIPAAFFIKKPQIPFKTIACYGGLTFCLQFSFSFVALHQGVAPGLASVLLQTQVFFSLLLAYFFLGERISAWQIVGALISFSGVALIATQIGTSIPLLGLLLMLASALSWGAGNLLAKKCSTVDPISLAVWASLVASPMVLLLSLIFEGPEKVAYSLIHISSLSAAAICYLSYLSTFFAYCAWGWLIRRLPLSTVAPLSLLVPIFGILSCVLILNEPLPLWKIIASMLVIFGLCMSFLGKIVISAKTKLWRYKATT